MLTKNGKKIVFLSSTIISPSLKEILKSFKNKYNNTEVVYFDTISKSSF